MEVVDDKDAKFWHDTWVEDLTLKTFGNNLTFVSKKIVQLLKLDGYILILLF